LIRHDPEFRSVRKEHLAEAGRRVRLKKDIPALLEFLPRGLEGYRFSFFVISAAPQEVMEAPEERIGTEPTRTIYVGDGSSDVHVMLHVNNRHGFTIAVSENKLPARIAKSTVLSESAFSVIVPILEQIVGWRSPEIRAVVESYGLTVYDWEKARTDRVTIRESPTADHTVVA
jgi:hypothetical protein